MRLKFIAGYIESVYEEAFCEELRIRLVPFKQQYPIIVHYKGKEVGEGRIDLIVGDVLIVELKASRIVSEVSGLSKIKRRFTVTFI